MLIEQLAADLGEPVPAAAIEAARQRLFDAVACYVAGASTAEGRILQRVFPSPSTEDRVRVAAGTIRSTELDDIHIPSCTTIGAIVVPAALFAAAERGCAGEDLLAGIVAGYEAMARLGCAVDGALAIYQGTWTTYLCAPLAAAAAVARVWGLPEDQQRHALAIAASRSTGMNARSAGHASSRWYMAGCAAAEGCLAARAGESGMAGDLNVLEQAFPRATGVSLDPKPLTDAGEWRILEIDVKPFRTSRQALAATQAFLDLQPGEAAAVQVWVPAQVKAMVDNPDFPLGVQRQLGMAARDPLSLWDAGAAREATADFAARVRVEADERLTALYPRQWGGTVEVTWRDGTTASREVLDPPGSRGAPMGWPELLAKHRKVAEASRLEAGWLDAAYERCRRSGSLAELVGLIGAAIGRAPSP